MSQNSVNKNNSIWGILSPYRSHVGKFISISKPLVKPDITVALVTKPFQIQPIDYGGIEVGTPVQVGSHLPN